ncbi:dynein assembly factor 5, axonemal [Drosophila pseudoobscura]|uniref:Dynein assembly factor 5, axonemal n=1 Tax=Drosophila pseudoobscura pseudoobscura TaxID=46245 RepID=A0A6I8VB47_DROPS|nr:dynein assembly factor 5, axonemal [Drosophila pseudoobscura]XP_033232574.1 dynein assembly factor 5, axonemal [Drosophila pseudoobscura]
MSTINNEEIEENTKKTCKDLESTDRVHKTMTLKHMLVWVENNSYDNSTELLAQYFDRLYLHLLKCYHDRFESVRDGAVRLVDAYLDRLPPMDFNLLNVVSTLTERMGQAETVEPSEEIRYLYIGQLHLMVRKYAKMGNVGVFRECYHLVVKVLIKALKDDYPLVQREACSTLVALCRVAETTEIRPFTEQLAVALYGMLNHKHAPARISAVEALGRLSLHMDASAESMRRLFGEVSPLLMDRMPLVRREVGIMGVLMLMDLLDRYSFFERILPLVLCCLKDDSPDVRNHIHPLWVKCGKQYYEENEAELSQQEICDLPVDNYPKNVKRPTIGCRGLVQRSLRLLTLITRETTDWKDNVRLHSLKLLYQFVVHAEAAMTAKFYEIYPDVSHACCDSVAEVSAEAAKVADLMGRLLCYEAWIEHGFDGLQRNARESYMKCFYYMFTASNSAFFEHLLRLCKLLRATEYSHTLKPGFQLYILKLLDTILNKSLQVTATEEELDELYMIVYIVGIKVMALGYSLNSDNADPNVGQMVLERIAQLQKVTLAQLHERYFEMALKDVENLDAVLEDNAEPVLLLDGLINICHLRRSYLKRLIERVKIVFENCSANAQIRIFSSLSMAALLWSSTVTPPDIDAPDEPSMMKIFVTEIVEPYLTWKAGASSESMRSLAMATLCALAQSAPEDVLEVLPSLVKHMPSLLEDRNSNTRNYAIKTVRYFRGLSVEELKPLAYATMQRLDDPSAGIRSMAALAVGTLSPIFEGDSEEEIQHQHEVWEAVVKRAMDLMLLYHESPEKNIKIAVEQSLEKMAIEYPEAWTERCQRAMAMSHQKDELNELYEKLSINKVAPQPSRPDPIPS